MPAVTGDLAQLLRELVVAILLADTRISAAPPTGKQASVVPFEESGGATLDADHPVIAYQFGVEREIGGVGDERLVPLTLYICTEGNNAPATGNAIAAYARETVDYIAFAARGLEAIQVPGSAEQESDSQDWTDEGTETTRAVNVVALRMMIQATAP
jgi:hypothetical protein